MRLSKAASFLSSQSQSLSPLIRSSNATAATATTATATRPLTLTALPKRTGKVPFEEEKILLQDDNNNNDISSKNVFYPVSPGDVVAEGKYSMISKLGWGRNSTVWLAEERGRWPGRGRWRWRYVLFFLFFPFFLFFLGSFRYGNCQSGTRAIRNSRILTAVFFLPLETSGSKSNNNHSLLSNSTIAMSTRMRFAMN